jgi:hypothetical protein
MGVEPILIPVSRVTATRCYPRMNPLIRRTGSGKPERLLAWFKLKK